MTGATPVPPLTACSSAARTRRPSTTPGPGKSWAWAPSPQRDRRADPRYEWAGAGRPRHALHAGAALHQPRASDPAHPPGALPGRRAGRAQRPGAAGAPVRPGAFAYSEGRAARRDRGDRDRADAGHRPAGAGVNELRARRLSGGRPGLAGGQRAARPDPGHEPGRGDRAPALGGDRAPALVGPAAARSLTVSPGRPDRQAGRKEPEGPAPR